MVVEGGEREGKARLALFVVLAALVVLLGSAAALRREPIALAVLFTVLAVGLGVALVAGRRDPAGFEPLALLSAGVLFAGAARAVEVFDGIATSGGQIGPLAPGVAPALAAPFVASALLGLASLARLGLVARGGRGFRVDVGSGSGSRSEGGSWRGSGAERPRRRGGWLALHSVVAAPFALWLVAYALLARDPGRRAPLLGETDDPRALLALALASLALIGVFGARALWRRLPRTRLRLAAALLPIGVAAWTAGEMVAVARATPRAGARAFVAPLSTTAEPARRRGEDSLVVTLGAGERVRVDYASAFLDPTEPVPEGAWGFKGAAEPDESLERAVEVLDSFLVDLDVDGEAGAARPTGGDPELDSPIVVLHAGPNVAFERLAAVLHEICAGGPRLERVHLSVRRAERMPVDWAGWISGTWPSHPYSGTIAVGWTERGDGAATAVELLVEPAAQSDGDAARRPVRCTLDGRAETSAALLGERLARRALDGAERAVLRCAPHVTYGELVRVLDLVREAGLRRIDLAAIE